MTAGTDALRVALAQFKGDRLTIPKQQLLEGLLSHIEGELAELKRNLEEHARPDEPKYWIKTGGSSLTREQLERMQTAVRNAALRLGAA